MEIDAPTQVKRRQFLFLAGTTIGSISAFSTLGRFARKACGQDTPTERLPTTNEIRDYLLRNSPWVNIEKTVDTVKCGDPNRPVKEAGVAWFSSIGDGDMKVSRPSVGVGCAVPDQEMVEFGADVLVMCYDGASYWRSRERLAEMGVGIVTVEHGTSEMPGLMSLREHLAEQFRSVEFAWIAEHPRTWTVKGHSNPP